MGIFAFLIPITSAVAARTEKTRNAHSGTRGARRSSADEFFAPPARTQEGHPQPRSLQILHSKRTSTASTAETSATKADKAIVAITPVPRRAVATLQAPALAVVAGMFELGKVRTQAQKLSSNASTGMLNGDGRIPQFLVTADSGVIPLWLRNDGGVEVTTMLT